MNNVLNIHHFVGAKQIGTEPDFANMSTLYWYELPDGTYIATERDGSFNRAVRTDPRSNPFFLAVED